MKFLYKGSNACSAERDAATHFSPPAALKIFNLFPNLKINIFFEKYYKTINYWWTGLSGGGSNSARTPDCAPQKKYF